MKFLITGASGFIGKKLSKRLLDEFAFPENEFIFFIHNNKIDFVNEYSKKCLITIIHGNLNSLGVIKKYLENVDYVFHLAAKVEYGLFNKSDYYDINVLATEKLFEICASNVRLKKIIYLSSVGIYHPTFDNFVNENTSIQHKHTTLYTKTKYLAYLKSEEFIKNGLPIINILPASVFGSNSPLFTPLIKFILKFRIIILPPLKYKLSLIYVDDLVEGIINTFKYGQIGESYIFSGKALSLEEIIVSISKLCDLKISVIRFPSLLFSVLLKALDSFFVLFRFNFFFNTEMYKFIKGGFTANDQKVREFLNFSNTDFDNNFKTMIDSIISRKIKSGKTMI